MNHAHLSANRSRLHRCNRVKFNPGKYRGTNWHSNLFYVTLTTQSWANKYSLLFHLIYIQVPLTVCWQLKIGHPGLSTPSGIQSLGCNKNQMNKRQTFAVSADCPSQGLVPCPPEVIMQTLSPLPFFQIPSNTWMEGALHICIYWLTWGREVIYFGKWIWYLSSSSLFQNLFPGVGKLFAITCSLSVVLKPKLFYHVRSASKKWLMHII